VISISYNDSFNEFKTPKKKQTERAFQEEEAVLLLLTLLVVLWEWYHKFMMLFNLLKLVR
jgi:hypothetical protein